MNNGGLAGCTCVSMTVPVVVPVVMTVIVASICFSSI